MNQVVVYSKGGCPFCSLLKNELKKKRIAFTEFDLSEDSVRDTFYKNTGLKTMPQLFVTDAESQPTQPSGLGFGGWSEVSKRWNDVENLISVPA